MITCIHLIQVKYCVIVTRYWQSSCAENCFVASVGFSMSVTPCTHIMNQKFQHFDCHFGLYRVIHARTHPKVWSRLFTVHVCALENSTFIVFLYGHSCLVEKPQHKHTITLNLRCILFPWPDSGW
jgi:hypothetical protein